MTAELGIIEGFYGRPWRWAERAETVRFLAPFGYRFYLYAPKSDPFLRRTWQEPHPVEIERELQALGSECVTCGVRFGIGLSPYGLHFDFNEASKSSLLAKLEGFAAIGVRDLGILFDDMRGDLPDLADRQARIVDWIAERFTGGRVIVCPSYYSDDPVLDRVFGTRPPEYLETLGCLLDRSIDIFWTGEEVCSREISPAHLDRVSEQLGRPPFLWDNYPVNDGQRMSQYLHLRAFTGRTATISSRIAAHGVNPALQPTLSRIPAVSLALSYQRGERYAYGAAFRDAAEIVVGSDLSKLLWEDLLILQDVGLDRLGEKADYLRARYAGINHPAAREIVDWLDGGFRITDAIVQTQ